MTDTPAPAPTPYRAMREAILLGEKRMTMRELARRTGINSGRLSIIERGVAPKPEEHAVLTRVLGELLTGQS